MQQRYLADDEIDVAKAMIGREFWGFPVVITAGCVGAGLGALVTGSPFGVGLFVFFAAITGVLWIARWRQLNRLTADIEKRVVEVLEGTPDKVWMAWRDGFCYLRLQGKTIQVPADRYEELCEANFVKIAFLPTALTAVRVEMSRGIGLSSV